MTLTELLSKFTEEDKKYLQQNAKNEKDFYDYFVTKGLTDSYEEFTAYLSQLKTLSSGEKELSDDELEKIAGGGIGDETPITLEDISGGSVLDRMLDAMSSPEKFAEFFGFYPPAA